MSTRLFSPLQLRDLSLRNRIVISPMLMYQANNGWLTDWHLGHYGQFASGGAGLVFVESTKVDPRGCSTPRDLGIWKDDFVPDLRRISELIHTGGGAAGIQIAHSGRKARCQVPWEGRMPIASAPNVDNVEGGEWELIGPSPLPHDENFCTPREMTHNDIGQVIDMWAAAARRANEAGFDVLELHSAHGYLMHQFLSPTVNQRNDEYGGSMSNRMRFPLQVVDAVRREWPEHKPLFVRISGVDGDDWCIEDSVAYARELKKHDVDVVDCSSGGMIKTAFSLQTHGLGYQVPLAEQVRAQADIRTMAVGLIVHAQQAEQILQDNCSDLIAIGREALHNPNWPVHAALELGVEGPFASMPDSYRYWLEKRAATHY
ncbi:MAG: NADH:flavin oxidoreductase/NADH oxidase [Arenicella sp.]|nr:NADH:flavin oxidoreductase/NADH oxidase [Arenicella sp.]